MKSFIRTIIVFAALSLAAGSFALAQNAHEKEDMERAKEKMEAAKIEMMKQAAQKMKGTGQKMEEAERMLERAWFPAAAPQMPLIDRTRRRSGIGDILVIPAGEVKAEQLIAIIEDMSVMSRIFDKKFSKGSRLIRGVFRDYGDFFRRDSRSTEAIYIQGYGALFLMQVNFPLTAPPKSKEKEAKKTEEPADPIWQQAKQEIFDPMIRTTRRISQPGEKYDAEQIEEVKKELVKSLKHAANIRNLKPNESVILSVTGGGDSDRAIVEVIPQSKKFLVFDKDTKDTRIMEMPLPGEIGFPSPTVLTIRVRKSDVDAFAKGELDYEKFREKVQMFTYPSLGQQVGRGHLFSVPPTRTIVPEPPGF